MRPFRQIGALAALLATVAFTHQAFAVTLWTEDAESGAGNIIDQTTGGYPLIQSGVVAQGSYAFHLANPSFQDNAFVINHTVTIQPTTKLFFLSQLRYATANQIAKAQISTNGGSTWPTDVYTQAGTGGPGEGSFSLKQINLAPYAGQNLNVRFLYDFVGGTAFTQTDSQVGWFVDTIQIGDQYQKIQWSVGDPSPDAQLYLEYVNRSRADALVEAQRLRNETNPDVLSAYSFYGINPQNIVNQYNTSVSNGLFPQHAQPLSFQPALITAATLHTQDQYQNQFQGHDSSNNPPAPFQPGYTLSQRLSAVGYPFTAAAENVFSTSLSDLYGHDGFEVDWGNVSNPSDPHYNPAFNGQGMQNPAGHRLNLHNPDLKEIGIGVINGTNGSVGPQVITEDLGSSGDTRYVTGVVYQDLNHNNFYDVGEGRSGVRVDVVGSAYYAISTTSGAYSVPVSQDGTYAVTFTGGGFQTFSTNATIAGGLNVKIDDLVTPTLTGDYNGNGIVDAADYTVWRDTLGSTSDLRANGDNTGASAGKIDQADYTIWKSNFGAHFGSGADAEATVPEPTSALLMAMGLLLPFSLKRRSLKCCGPQSRRRRVSYPQASMN
jgi:uncharacterized protein YkwD